MKNSLDVFFCFLLLAGCQSGSSEKEQREALESQVLAVHDTAMADMDKLMLLRRQLSQLRDSLSDGQADTSRQRLLARHIILLQKADAAMMNWMHNYMAPAVEQPHAATMAYLQQELKKMEAVKNQIDSTLQAARQMHKQHEFKK